MRRLLLIRHGSTGAVTRAAFPVDEPLDGAGRAAAARLAGRLGRGDAVCGPRCARARPPRRRAWRPPSSRRCASATSAAGGRTLAEVHAAEPAATAAWMTDPDAAPHGGESTSALLQRVGAWLSGEALRDGRAIAITHAGVVRAAVVHALGAPAGALWRVDVAPLAVTELHAHDGRWTVARVNAPVAPDAGAPS